MASGIAFVFGTTLDALILPGMKCAEVRERGPGAGVCDALEFRRVDGSGRHHRAAGRDRLRSVCVLAARGRVGVWVLVTTGVMVAGFIGAAFYLDGVMRR